LAVKDEWFSDDLKKLDDEEYIIVKQSDILAIIQ
jgi:co-chaperonin GroES (HSP10)